MARSPSIFSRFPAILIAVAAIAVVGGCSSGFSAIDASIERLLLDSSTRLGEPAPPRGDAVLASARAAPTDDVSAERRDPNSETLATRNPPAGELAYVTAGPEGEAAVIDRLRGYAETGAGAIELRLEDALVHAVAHSREFRFQEETYLLAGMRLLVQRHLWGPRFFNDVIATVSADGDDGLYDTSLDLVNELRVTQRLPYGGEVSARALALATEDLHRRVAGENVQSAEIILAADIPLLRGAGTAAREGRIQTERDLVYAARDFARFRREFLFQITRDYLDLIVDQQQIDNARRTVDSFQRLERRQEALYRAGRATPFAYAEAQNETLDAEDRLVASSESYRLALDRFKVRIGMPVEQPVDILPDSLDLPAPLLDIESSVAAALSYRLDLQTSQDEVDDAVRGVDVAKNAVLADVDLFAEVSIPTNDERGRAGLDFESDDTSYSAGVSVSLPLDRTIERLNVRQSEIELERARREHDQLCDSVSINVRGAVRAIDSALFSYQLQETNVEIAAQREASIKADPARATIQAQTDAINQTSRARDARDGARRNLEVAILAYLLETGTLRVDAEGRIQRLEGMAKPDRQ